MNFKEMIVWIIGLVLCGVVILSPVACTMNQQRIIADAVKQGVDPVAAKCAIESGISHTTQCISHAMQKDK